MTELERKTPAAGQANGGTFQNEQAKYNTAGQKTRNRAQAADVDDLKRQISMEDLAAAYGVQLKRSGNELKAICPFPSHEDKTPSFTITPSKNDSGFYCFGCGEGGDQIEFLKLIESTDFKGAVRHLKELVGDATFRERIPRRTAPKTPAPPDRWQHQSCPHDTPPPETIRMKRGDSWADVPVVMAWPYRDADGVLHGYTCRIEPEPGKKEIIPLSWMVNTETGEARLKQKSLSEPRLLYGSELLARHPNANVIITEGEKAADAARRMLGDHPFIVLTWPGGCKAVKKADWSLLAGRKVVIWPDCDSQTDRRTGESNPYQEQPGMSAALETGHILAGLGCKVRIIAVPYPGHLADGWDAADAEAEGWTGADVMAYIKANIQKAQEIEAMPAAENRPIDEAQELADQIHGQLLAMLGVKADEKTEAASLEPDAERISRMIHGAFWSGSKSKVFLLNHAESLVQFREPDAFKFLIKTFGEVIDRAAVEELAKRLSFGCDKPEAEDNARRKFVNGCMAVAKTAILDHLKYHNQRESIEWRVDMFGEFSRLELLEDRARIVLTHKPFPEFDKPQDYTRIISDYKEHFSRFDDFLKFVAMSRFALDRKKSYLWLLADSDWGKGFLTGVLKALGACVETSMKEVEAMLEGKPVGRSAEDFKRALVLLIDEFKTVKSELKQLQSEVTLSPKNQLSCTVEVFAKVFTSAESVGSLVTENGVEDQFANRMSIFQESGDITRRPIYLEVGNPRYFRAVLAYSAEYLNLEVSAMQQLGRESAEKQAEEWLNGFIRRYGLDTVYERFSDSLPQLAGEIMEHLQKRVGFDDLIVTIAGDTYIKSPAKVVDDYLADHFDHSQIAAFRKKKDELLRMMSEDGSGNKTHRITSMKPFKAVKLRKL